MIDAKGEIIAIEGDFALVRVEEHGCGRCHEEGGCGGHNLGTMLCRSSRVFRVSHPGQAVVGDWVTVSVDEKILKQTALVAYGIPLLTLFLGAFSGSLLAGEVGAISGSVVGLAFGWLGVRRSQLTDGGAVHKQPFIRP